MGMPPDSCPMNEVQCEIQESFKHKLEQMAKLVMAWKESLQTDVEHYHRLMLMVLEDPQGPEWALLLHAVRRWHNYQNSSDALQDPVAWASSSQTKLRQFFSIAKLTEQMRADVI